MKKLKQIISRLTIASWLLIILVIGGVIAAAVILTSKQSPEPVVNEETGLIENAEDLPPVKEGEDKTGEILPPEAPASESEPADITGDDLSYPTE